MVLSPCISNIHIPKHLSLNTSRENNENVSAEVITIT